jgi:hypothetical protein
VCNLADCIKIAIDFVSPENIDRCERLTREFREQNQSMAWKEDVLQLRTMMWFAWLSCCRQEREKGKGKSTSNGAHNTASSSSNNNAATDSTSATPAADNISTSPVALISSV